MKRLQLTYKKILAIVLILPCLLFGGCSDEKKPTKTTTAPPKTLEDYAYTEVVRGNLEDITYSPLTTVTARRYSLSFKRSGYLTEIADGDTQVKKGDVIAKLDTTQIDLEIKNAKTEIEKAKLALAALQRTDPNTSDVELKMAETKVRQLDDEYVQKKWKYGSAPNTEQQLELDRIALELQKAQRQYEALKSNSISPKEDLSNAKAVLKQAENTLAILETSLSEYVITAPVDGYLNYREHIALLTYIEAGTVMWVLEDTSKFYLKVDPERAYNPDKFKSITMDNYLRAQISIYLPGSGENAGSYPAKVIPYTTKNDKGEEFLRYKILFEKLPPGMIYEDGYYSVDPNVKDENGDLVGEKFLFHYTKSFSQPFFLIVVFDEREDVLIVPTASVQMIADGTNSYGSVLVLENDVFVERIINVGFQTEEATVVKSGLKEGDKVATELLDKKKDNQQTPESAEEKTDKNTSSTESTANAAESTELAPESQSE